MEWSLQQIDIPQELLLLLLIHVPEFVVLREVEHDVLKFEVSVDDEDRHHVVEAHDDHLHDFLDDLGIDFELLELHKILHVAAIAVVHEHVVSRVRLDRLP